MITLLIDKFLPLIAGYIIGFLFCVLFYGKTEGDSGIIPNCRIQISGKRIFYLHHWLGFSFLLVVLLIVQIKTRLIPEIIFYSLLGILLGGINQGLLYKDWYILIKH